MKAMEVLKEEHQVIRRIVIALGKATHALEQGESVRPAFFLEVTEFIRAFADGCHHHKEEEVLFPALEANPTPTQRDLLVTMRSEHVRARLYTRALREAARRLGRGDESARNQVINSAQVYVRLLWSHMEKEDGVAFPMAEQILSPDQQTQMTELFEHWKEEETTSGFRDKYLALASALETEADSLPPRT